MQWVKMIKERQIPIFIARSSLTKKIRDRKYELKWKERLGIIYQASEFKYQNFHNE